MNYMYRSDSGQRKSEKTVSVKEVQFPEFSDSIAAESSPSDDYLDLLMNVKLDVRVEIGKTTKTMSEIMKLSQGSIITLEKPAGSPVDVIANDQIIARGDVVVIEENFGVRITEILNRNKFIPDKK